MHRTTICSKTLVFYLSTAISPRGQSSLALFCLAFLRVQGFDDPDLLEAFPGLAVAAPESEPQSKGGPAPTQGERGEGGEEEEEELKVASQAEAECALLERAAHYALMMNADLQVWKPLT